MIMSSIAPLSELNGARKVMTSYFNNPAIQIWCMGGRDRYRHLSLSTSYDSSSFALRSQCRRGDIVNGEHSYERGAARGIRRRIAHGDKTLLLSSRPTIEEM